MMILLNYRLSTTINLALRTRTAAGRNLGAIRLTHTNHTRTQELTFLEKIIHDNIKATGPISFARYMKICLSHPTHGYYMNRDHQIFGKEGDFITSPEISQTFGELIGIWLYSRYLGRSEPIRIIELGPGRGTLVEDMLRVISRFHSRTIDVHLVETSAHMRSVQKQKLSSRQNITLHWHNSIAEVKPSSEVFTFLVAHEFFDALPVYVIRKTGERAWRDVVIAPIDDKQSSASPTEVQTSSDRFVTLRPTLASVPSEVSSLLGQSSKRFGKLPVGSQIEVSPDAYRIARKVGELLQSGKDVDGKPSLGGCGLIIDYGEAKPSEDSLRAFKNHSAVDLFYKPGECDMTANVDFGYLTEAMQDIVRVVGPISQRSFLSGLQIEERTKALASAAESEQRKQEIQNASNRLVDPQGMGTQYQFLGIVSKDVTGAVLPHPFGEADNT